MTRSRLRLALRIGAGVWLLLLVAGFFSPGGWTWGVPGPIGHMQNYVISLWFVVLVLAPLIGSRDPETNASAIVVYVLGILGILVSTIRGELPKPISDAPPWAAGIMSVALLLWARLKPASLLRR